MRAYARERTSAYDTSTGTSVDNPRQQLNRITAFIDGSQIYGSDAERASALRTGVGGRLKNSDGNLLPYNTDGLANDNATGLPPETLFLAGDVRANENIELTSLHTLFVREHNRLADQIAARNPNWSDEQIYQQARKLVIAELQIITYNEFLPALLGDFAISRYRGYNRNVDPGVATEFSTAAFRLGRLFRAIISDQFERLRDGDRFWYERSLSNSELRQVRGTTLADLISRNTTTTNLQDDVFFFFNSIEGQVFLDADGDGRVDRNERGMRGITVQLLDEDGNVIASAITGRDGSYAFEELELSVYTVRIVLPRGWQETTRGPYEIDLTRAEEFSSVNFGIKPRSRNFAPSVSAPAAEPDAVVTAPESPKKVLDPLAPRAVTNS